MNYETVSEETWDALRPRSLYAVAEEILNLLQDGQYVRVSFKDRGERHGFLVSIGQKARRRGVHLDYRVGENCAVFRPLVRGNEAADEGTP